MEQYSRDFKGVFVPKEIWLDKTLNWTDKIVFVEIDSLCKENGCYATNEYLANFCNCSIATITRAISKLKNLNLITEIRDKRNVRILKTYTCNDKYGKIAIANQNDYPPNQNDYPPNQNDYPIYINNTNKETTSNKDIARDSNESLTYVSQRQTKHPTVADVNLYIKQRASATGMKEEDICNAEFFVDYYTSGDWKDSKGNPVKNWKQKIVSVWEGKDWWKSAKSHTPTTDSVKISKSFKESCQRLGLHWESSYSKIAAEVKNLRHWYVDCVSDDTFLAKNQRSSWGGLCMYIESFWDSYLTFVSDVIGPEPPQPAFFKVNGNMFNSWCRDMGIEL